MASMQGDMHLGAPESPRPLVSTLQAGGEGWHLRAVACPWPSYSPAAIVRARLPPRGFDKFAGAGEEAGLGLQL